MKYIYGPVNSRRIGRSLGITLTPHKICNFDCVYCQLGKTKEKTIERKEYFPIREVYRELVLWLKDNPQQAKKLSFITISGLGEPTLNTKIGELIRRIKKATRIPVCVITNASFLNDPGLRRGLASADLIVPSLDSVDTSIFKAIDRPHQQIKLEEIISGLIKLRKEYKGKIWLEVMLVRGLNDATGQIEKLKGIIALIKPDKIQLNSPVRATAEAGILALESKELEKIKESLGDKCEII